MIKCKDCEGHGYFFAGSDYYTSEPITEECSNCDGFGYLPLLGWAVLESTYGSKINTVKRNLDFWMNEAAKILEL